MRRTHPTKTFQGRKINLLCRESLASVQASDAFDVGRVGEEIEGLDGPEFVAILEEGQVPGQGGRVTRLSLIHI